MLEIHDHNVFYYLTLNNEAKGKNSLTEAKIVGCKSSATYLLT